MVNGEPVLRPDRTRQVQPQPVGLLRGQGGDDEPCVARVGLDLVVDRDSRVRSADLGVVEGEALLREQRSPPFRALSRRGLGVVLPCWSWASEPGLYSGKHKTTGMNVQVVCTLEGELVWISDPVAGARHDVYCLDQSGALDGLVPDAWTGDKGYVGRGMVTPIKKIEGVELLDWQKAFNTAINQTRAAVERVIANLKTWRILHTDYRRPLGTFDTTISAVIGLQFYSLV